MTTLDRARGAVSARQHEIPMQRIVPTELRKMFDTRSGFWLLISIGLLAALAAAAVVAFAPDGQQTYATFTTAINIPMTIVLPVLAILSVTGEWSQRSGLGTFALVPQRGRVIAAKAIAAVGVGLVTIPICFGIGAVGNLIGAAIDHVRPVWDQTVLNLLTVLLANVLSLLFGFMLGVLIRNSVGALVGYFVYQFLLPAVSLILAGSQAWFRRLQPWVDFDHAQSALYGASTTSQDWVHLAVTGTVWLVIPMIIGLALVTRADVD